MPLAARAQAVQLAVAGGVAIPTDDYGETRTTGPLVRGTLLLRGPERRVRFRMDAEGAWLLDRTDRAITGSSRDGTMRVVSALASVVIGGTGPRIAPYLLAGAGVQRLTVEGTRNPYGRTLGMRAGAGVRWLVGRVEMNAEITPHWALTDFGTGREFGLGSYVPVAIGVGVSF